MFSRKGPEAGDRIAFHLKIDDYLAGLLILANTDLVRIEIFSCE